MRERSLALALALALLVAGCAVPFGAQSDPATEAPTTPTAESTPTDGSTPPSTPTDGTTTATPTPTPEPSVQVRGGNLSVDADLLFERVLVLTGRDVAPPTVTVRDLGGKTTTIARTDVHRLLGMGLAQLNLSRSTGLTRTDGSVFFDPRGDRADVERRLAHEFVHVVQFRADLVDGQRSYDARRSTDFTLAWRLVVEGGAVHVTDAYVDEHMPGATRQSTVFAREYDDAGAPATRLVLAPYHLGSHYAAAQADSPSDLAAVSEPFPNTTEQVLHNETPNSEPPVPLSVAAEDGGRWSALDRQDRTGELYIRLVLSGELSRERAAGAAAGWGNDSWQLYRSDDRSDSGLAWVTRWDDAGEAEEFAAAARTYADRREGDRDGALRVERLDEDTVVLFAGDPGFVENATATTGEDGVAVAPNGSAGG